MLPTHAPAPKEQSPLLASAKKAGASGSISAFGQGSCLLVAAFTAACIFGLALTVLRGHAVHRPVLPAVHAPRPHDGCMTADSVASYQSLDRLFTKHSSGRSSQAQSPSGYHKLYSSLFLPHKNLAKIFVEIGASKPGLLSWRDYFTNAKVVGMDVDPNIPVGAEERVVMLAGTDTTNPFNFLRADLSDAGIDSRANIIIDGGGHDPTLQGRSLENLYDVLEDGGVYVVEGLHRKPDGGHHFCGMAFEHPFVFGSMKERGTTRTDYITRKLQHIVADSDVFYTSMGPGFNDSSAMVLLKNLSFSQKPFAKMPHNYHVVYNALLSSLPIRSIASSRSLHKQSTAAACGDPAGIDVIIASAQEGISKDLLYQFQRARSGSFLFVENISFSFCNGSPDPAAITGAELHSILSGKSDWFYAMTDSNEALAAKILIMRKN